MMETRTKLIVFGVGAAVILTVIIIGVISIYRLTKQSTSWNLGQSGNLSNLPTIIPSPTITTTPTLPTQAYKTYIWQGISLSYPSNWGILICRNSFNIELDPDRSLDQRDIVCSTALKPITILTVGRLVCPGEKISLGSHQVIKSVQKFTDGIDYRWCLTVGNKNLDITHRVSPNGSQASSRTDYSVQVEEMIKTIKVAPAAS